MDAEDIKEWMAEHHMEDAKTKAAGKGKHIFSHVEWNMIGYKVRVDELEKKCTEQMLFVHPEEIERNYPI
ncbi:NUDIX domain-containing protein, partial [Terrisporobacter mayombei]|uniref:NUDIX domain-containing protein n=1 Tax=Terrisporobacter mayombei TaxID=1541 RepID=UPI002F3F082F